jgi:hypothetical protein
MVAAVNVSADLRQHTQDRRPLATKAGAKKILGHR